MPANPLIKMENVSLSFGAKRVLEEVSLTLSEGEITTVIGPNGAGKTSLVKLVLGLLQPSEGQITRQQKLRIGYMPQRFHCDPNLPIKVRDFLALSGAKPQACRETLDELGIAHLADAPVQSLSGGETQHLLLARAILRQPNLLVLDEPAQGVDVGGQARLYRLIGEIRDRLGCGVLSISHDLHLVMSTADAVVCLNQHICCHGHPEQGSSDPAYLQLFGNIDTEGLGLYTHHHDHEHDVHGDIVDHGDGGGDGCCH